MRVTDAVPIGQVVRKVDRWNPSRERPENRFTYIDLSSIDQERKKIDQVTVLVGKDAPSRAKQIVSVGDVLVSTVRPNLNGVARVSADLEGATASTGFCVLRPDGAQIDPDYLFYWVRSPQYVNEMVRLATGASYPAVTDRIVFNSKIPLPSLEEQRRIAAILGKADELRAKRRAATEKLETLIKSIFIDMFGDPVTNPMGFRSVPFVDLLSASGGYVRGPFGSALKKEIFVESGFAVYEQANAISDDTTQFRYFIDASHYDGLSRFQVAPSDIIVSCSGTIGKASMLDSQPIKGVINQALLKLSVNPELIEPEFLLHFVQADYFQRRFSGSAVGTGMKNVASATEIRAIPAFLPPVAVQNRFVEAVKSVERQHMSIAQSRTELDDLFSTLQQRAFRGEL